MSAATNNSTCRLCNNVILNSVFSILASQNDLYIEYAYHDECEKLGIKLFCGINKYDKTIYITDSDVIQLINGTKDVKLESNIKNNGSYFQTKEISNYLFKYYFPLFQDNIMLQNKFKSRYNSNNDIFIHIRLGDITYYNPGYEYYVKAIQSIKDYNNVYISSDTISHEICNKLITNFNAIPIEYDEVDTIHFGSTCKHVILSHGSFSAVIGYLSFYSDVYYPEFQTHKLWCGDMFSIPGWNKITY